MTGSEEDLSAAKFLIVALDSITARRLADVWAFLKKLAPLHTFPKYGLHFRSIYYKDKGLFKTFPNMSTPQGHTTWCRGLSRVDVHALLAAECGALAKTFKKSTIPKLTAGFRLFAAGRFEIEENVRLATERWYIVPWLIRSTSRRNLERETCQLPRSRSLERRFVYHER